MTIRRLGYQMLGSKYDYLLHLRPAEWPIVTIHTLVGTVLAVGFRGLPFLSWPHLLAALGVWVVCLNGATLAINSAFDRDVTDVAYLRAPPPPPRHLFIFGLVLMAFGAGVSRALPPGFQMAYGLCVVMSLLYSVPPARLKAVAGLDWMINIWGFGVLTPYAGWAATGTPVTPVGRLVLLGFCPLFGALYPLTQLYQLEEDRARGDSTMASVLGVRGSLGVATVCVLAAFALFAAAGGLAGWTVHRSGIGRLVALAMAALAWGVVLGRWITHGDRIESRVHQGYMYFALGAWAVTDAAILYGFG